MAPETTTSLLVRTKLHRPPGPQRPCTWAAAVWGGLQSASGDYIERLLAAFRDDERREMPKVSEPQVVPGYRKENGYL